MAPRLRLINSVSAHRCRLVRRPAGGPGPSISVPAGYPVSETGNGRGESWAALGEVNSPHILPSGLPDSDARTEGVRPSVRPSKVLNWGRPVTPGGRPWGGVQVLPAGQLRGHGAGFPPPSLLSPSLPPARRLRACSPPCPPRASVAEREGWQTLSRRAARGAERGLSVEGQWEVREEVGGEGPCKGPGADTGLAGNGLGQAQRGAVWLDRVAKMLGGGQQRGEQGC